MYQARETYGVPTNLEDHRFPKHLPESLDHTIRDDLSDGFQRTYMSTHAKKGEVKAGHRNNENNERLPFQ